VGRLVSEHLIDTVGHPSHHPRVEFDLKPFWQTATSAGSESRVPADFNMGKPVQQPPRFKKRAGLGFEFFLGRKRRLRDSAHGFKISR
jgi:hypothetical protein